LPANLSSSSSKKACSSASEANEKIERNIQAMKALIIPTKIAGAIGVET
jgi:hypothetical protein